MSSIFVRKVRTASGATAVQIVRKDGRSDYTVLDHVGSAHTDAELELLLAEARRRMDAGQMVLLAFKDEAPAMAMLASRSRLLWDALASVYSRLGFDAVGDETFRQLVVARIVRPASKLETTRILADLGLEAPSTSSIQRCLARCAERGYREALQGQLLAHAPDGSLTLLLYDDTTLYFETQREDEYRKPGLSKERRLEPQITVGLLTGRDGFPLEVQSFEGNRAEVKTVMEVLLSFRGRYGEGPITVTADAAMLSSRNIAELEAAGYDYIIGSRIAKCPFEIAAYELSRGEEPEDGKVFDLEREFTVGGKRVKRRVVYQYREKRARLDLRNIEKRLEKAERMVAGKAEVKRNPYVEIRGGERAVNWDLVEENRLRAGIKGYVTSLSPESASPAEVIEAYHQLFQVERSFRMSKSDLRARPIHHRKRESIEAHLTVVLAALAISREIQRLTGVTIRRFKEALEPLRTGTVEVNGQILEIPPQIPDEARDLLRKLAFEPDRRW